jgi:hypothetical protein
VVFSHISKNLIFTQNVTGIEMVTELFQLENKAEK